MQKQNSQMLNRIKIRTETDQKLGPGHKVRFKKIVLVVLQCLSVPWKFCNQIPLAFKVKFPGGSQSLCLIPRLGNLLWPLELLQQCENFFGIIVLQFWGHLLGGSMVGLMATSSQEDLHHPPCHPGLLQLEAVSPRQATADL